MFTDTIILMTKQILKGYQFSYDWLPVDELHSIVCVVCNGKNDTNKVFAFMVNGKEFSIMHCLIDDLLFLSPQPGSQYTEALYNHKSYFTGEDDMYGLDASEEKSTSVAKIRITEISEQLTKKGKGTIAEKSLLEVGCAYGHTLLEAKRAGASGVQGIEFSRDAVDICTKLGLDVALGSVNTRLEKTLSGKTYDIIAAYSLLEHVNNPLYFLEQVRPLLNEDGILVIRVPEMSTNGPWLSLLDHFWHFTRSSLKHMLELSGFEITEIFPSGTFQGLSHSGELNSITVVASLK